MVKPRHACIYIKKLDGSAQWAEQLCCQFKAATQSGQEKRERDVESRNNATALSLSLVAEKHIAAAKKEGKKEKKSRNNIY